MLWDLCWEERLSAVRCDKVCVKASYQQSRMDIRRGIAVRNKC